MHIAYHIRRAALAKKEFDEAQHPRHPAGAPGGKGGQFAPKGATLKDGAAVFAPSDGANPHAEARAFLESGEAFRLTAPLTPEEMAGVEMHYSEKHKAIASTLRDYDGNADAAAHSGYGDTFPIGDPDTPPPEFVEKWIKGIDGAMKKSRLAHPVVVYRGVFDADAALSLGWEDAIALRDPNNLTDETEVTHEEAVERVKGTTFIDNGYPSTSLDPTVARSFMFGEERAALIEIRLPAGMPALSGLALRSVEREGSAIGKEVEITLPRDTEFRITGARHDGETLIFEAEPIYAAGKSLLRKAERPAKGVRRTPRRFVWQARDLTVTPPKKPKE